MHKGSCRDCKCRLIEKKECAAFSSCSLESEERTFFKVCSFFCLCSGFMLRHKNCTLFMRLVENKYVRS